MRRLYNDTNSWIYNNCREKLQEGQKIEEDEKLDLVDQAITNLEKTTGSNPTPMAVKDWITLHNHIDLPLSEISKYMQKVYEKRGERSLYTILLSKTITSDDEAQQDDRDGNNNSEKR
jgi:hypothetical protein